MNNMMPLVLVAVLNNIDFHVVINCLYMQKPNQNTANLLAF